MQPCVSPEKRKDEIIEARRFGAKQLFFEKTGTNTINSFQN